jgi:hypothetical protein
MIPHSADATSDIAAIHGVPLTNKASRLRRMKLAIALVSMILAIGACEVLLRVSLFHSSVEFASQDPEYYARTLDELWIYRQLFSRSKRWSVPVSLR